jgi:DNA-binding MarR family transcriptional regulator
MIFISYSQKDQAQYSSLCVALENASLPYWDSKTMKAGSLKDQLVQAIRQCDVCIFIATRSSVESKWCLAETGAFWGAGKCIVLFKADSAIDDRKMPPLFEGDLWIDDVRVVISQAREGLADVNKRAQPADDSEPAIQSTKPSSQVETRLNTQQSDEQLPALTNNSDFDETEINILRILAKYGKALTVQKLESALQLQITRVQRHLDALEERQYVQVVSTRVLRIPAYCLSKKGREYVVANKLI